MAFSQFPNSARRESFEEDIRVAPLGAEPAPGRISYSPETGIGLVVIEADWLPQPGEGANRSWPVLHGEAFKGPKFSLFDCGVRAIQKSAGRSRAEIYAATLALGTQAKTIEEIELKRLVLSLRGLREWLTGSYSQIEPTLKKIKSQRGGRILNLDVGEADLQLVVESRETGGPYRWVEETHASLNVTVPQPIALSRWRDIWIRPLRDLMVFANRERSVVESLSGSLDPVDPRSSVRIFERQETRLGEESFQSFYQRDLLPAGIIDTADLVRAWFELHAKLGPAASFLFGTLNSAAMTTENEFLNLMAFAEAYHRILHDKKPLSKSQHRCFRTRMVAALPEDPFVRDLYERDLRYSNRQSQRDRIAWLVCRAEEVSWPNGLAEELTSTACDTRNWLTHWNQRGKHVVEHGDLALFNRRLLYVIESNLLEDLLPDDDAVSKCLAHGYVWDYPFQFD
jgi:hypothetical protein